MKEHIRLAWGMLFESEKPLGMTYWADRISFDGPEWNEHFTNHEGRVMLWEDVEARLVMVLQKRLLKEGFYLSMVNDKYAWGRPHDSRRIIHENPLQAIVEALQSLENENARN